VFRSGGALRAFPSPSALFYLGPHVAASAYSAGRVHAAVPPVECGFEKSKSFQMTRREQWRRVLDIEVQRWSAMTPEQLAATLVDKEQVYEVELDSKMYQVEVEILESTEEYFHVMV
jgi:hypothetical protein